MGNKTPKIRKLTLSRHPCYGFCPVYAVTLKAGGAVSWCGGSYVKVLGSAKWSISPETFAKIEAALYRADFKSLSVEGKYRMTCNPGCEITVRYADGTSKKLYHYHGVRPIQKKIINLENKLDKLLGTAPYVEGWIP